MKVNLLSKWGRLSVLFLLFLSVSVLIASCSDSVNEPAVSVTQDQNILSKDNPQVKAVIEVQERHTADLMNIDEVVGTAVGLTEDGRPCILVLTKTDLKANALLKGMPDPIPAKLENVPVVSVVTGEIKAFKTTTGVSHTAKQTAPIQLGTSGGWRYDLANGYCCGGTLGALVSKGGSQYILSNYHVLEADVISGGNNRKAVANDPVVQPGLIDINCNAANGQDVATLSGIKSLPGSNVDAAIALVKTGMVRTDGAILEVGTISASIVEPLLNQKVKKSGRTTGLTRSTVSGLNATVNITYENECAGGTVFTKTFTGQIFINNKGSRFLAGGDSGSLMVEDAPTNPRAVGLLFAGSSSIAVANPIGQVLSFFGASMVGN